MPEHKTSKIPKIELQVYDRSHAFRMAVYPMEAFLFQFCSQYA